jgi:D-alanyl-D-alanine carboxypeptidase (penicillin-binding protein 5/6)
MTLIFALQAVLLSLGAVPAAPVPAVPGTAEYYAALPESYYCIEASTGAVLDESNADTQRPPASMIKMMLMLMVDEGVQAGRWNYDTPVTISKNAEGMGGTQVYVKTGDSHTLGQLMPAVAVASANDASMAVAEGLWGTREAYIEAMNKRAQELGMTGSKFNSVHGLPPSKGQEFDLTTARDMARLGQECVGHPQILEWTSQKELTFRASDGTKQTTNKLLGVIAGVDGLKTGYIRAAGFCITVTALRDGIRVIAVVMGDTKQGRFERAQEVLESAFKKVKRVRPVVAGAAIGKPIPVTNGVGKSVGLLSKGPLDAVVRNEDVKGLQLEISVPTEIEAPVPAGAPVGTMSLKLGDTIFGQTELVTASAVEAKGLWRRMGEWTGLK